MLWKFHASSWHCEYSLCSLCINLPSFQLHPLKFYRLFKAHFKYQLFWKASLTCFFSTLTLPVEGVLFQYSLPIIFIQQIFIGNILCSGPYRTPHVCFSHWHAAPWGEEPCCLHFLVPLAFCTVIAYRFDVNSDLNSWPSVILK